MAANPLTPTLDDAEVNDALVTAGGQEWTVPREVLILLRNVQHQLDALDARVTVLEP